MLKHKNKFISFFNEAKLCCCYGRRKKNVFREKNLEIGNFEIDKKWNEEKEKKKNVNWKFQQ